LNSDVVEDMNEAKGAIVGCWSRPKYR